MNRLRRLAILLLATSAACGGAEPDRPNVLIVSLDSTRRDLLSCYGRDPLHAPGVPTSPALDRLAAQGVLMEDAYTTTSWTLPSHLALFTGEPAHVHAVEQSYHRLPAGVPTLTQALKAAGYATAGFYSGPFLEPSFGFARGFDRYEACYGTELEAASQRAAELAAQRDAALASGDQRALQAALAEHDRAKKELQRLSHHDVSSARVTDAVLGELERRAADERPFFLFAHFFDPHYDYEPPAPHDRFDPGYAGGFDPSNYAFNPAVAGPPQGPGPRERRIGERDLEHVVALYEGELAWTDAQVGRVLDKLDELGLADDTLVIVVADHGDEFFEHGSIGHRRTLFEEVVRVPMLLRLPGVLPAGERVAGLVSLLDVPATVLELVGLPAFQSSTSTSFAGLLRGEPDPARSVLGRIVLTFQVSFDPPPGGVQRIPGKHTFVVETFRQGPIKVTRERSWRSVRGSVNPAYDAAASARAAQERSAELVRWIDVVAHPDERSEDHVEDFADARARETLHAFRRRYAELAERRVAAARGEHGEDVGAMLSGLGYAGDEEAGGGPSDEFDLPPPGDAVLAR
jgi:arylsulfatase A-like enzyme